mgnify:CR=1 FL=1
MKKSILTIGKVLSKTEQNRIIAGRLTKKECCDPAIHCCDANNINYSGVGCMYQYGDPTGPNPPYYTNCI